MRPTNKLIQSINVERPFIVSFYKILCNSIPECLYTYDTARASYNEDFYIESSKSDEVYDLMSQIVSDLYGRDRMDNKITLEFIYNNNGSPLPIYVSYYDGRISVSSNITFWSGIDGENSYRVIKFDGIKF